MTKRYKLTTMDLKMAVVGLEYEKEKIDAGIAEVRRLLGAAARPMRRRNPISAAGRRRISAAQKKRWAEFRKAKRATAAVPPVAT